ncbi:MAG: hypothetical protein A2Y15_00870 [Clostridiales bacterium GWF2_36_10]|nr:MAG: hypothetical protein A2Y15_00870 [Clostridiales bacterium GWF2_36_10]
MLYNTKLIKTIAKLNNRTKLLALGVLFSTVIILILVIIISGSTTKNEDESYYSVSQNKWPNNDLTENFPEFEGDIYSVLVDDKSTAVFAKNVEKNIVDEYAAKFSEQGISFTGEDYPKKTQTDKCYITLAYDVATKNFSVTFTLPDLISK